jgi:hypothetical protein
MDGLLDRSERNAAVEIGDPELVDTRPAEATQEVGV